MIEAEIEVDMAEMRKVYDETGRELYMGRVIGSMTEVKQEKR